MFDDINIFHVNGTYKTSYYFEKITSIYFKSINHEVKKLHQE